VEIEVFDACLIRNLAALNSSSTVFDMLGPSSRRVQKSQDLDCIAPARRRVSRPGSRFCRFGDGIVTAPKARIVISPVAGPTDAARRF